MFQPHLPPKPIGNYKRPPGPAINDNSIHKISSTINDGDKKLKQPKTQNPISGRAVKPLLDNSDSEITLSDESPSDNDENNTGNKDKQNKSKVQMIPLKFNF